jgi:hypothetical protein
LWSRRLACWAGGRYMSTHVSAPPRGVAVLGMTGVLQEAHFKELTCKS